MPRKKSQPTLGLPNPNPHPNQRSLREDKKKGLKERPAPHRTSHQNAQHKPGRISNNGESLWENDGD
jgi:hypothetical protein